MADCRLDLIAKTEAESLVKVTCAHCHDTRMIAVAVAGDVATAAPRVSVRDEPLTTDPVISADEVLDLRLLLRQHEGDFQSLLTRPGDAS
ncbi:MAG TPA: hypothetical protein VET65_11875 [Candidatus Limnocylindrales bacterium]|nr:hypothetical protein [Candidatus Limnocylindrales bacterium]